jgi:hypothetical protein
MEPRDIISDVEGAWEPSQRVEVTVSARTFLGLLGFAPLVVAGEATAPRRARMEVSRREHEPEVAV